MNNRAREIWENKLYWLNNSLYMWTYGDRPENYPKIRSLSKKVNKVKNFLTNNNEAV
jgi:hypothetical protein